MPITILKNSVKKFKLSLTDNEGYTYTPAENSFQLTNDAPELGDVSFDEKTMTGTVISKDVNGVIHYRFQCLTLKSGKAVYGSDSITIADEVPPEDANKVVVTYLSV